MVKTNPEIRFPLYHLIYETDTEFVKFANELSRDCTIESKRYSPTYAFKLRESTLVKLLDLIDYYCYIIKNVIENSEDTHTNESSDVYSILDELESQLKNDIDLIRKIKTLELFLNDLSSNLRRNLTLGLYEHIHLYKEQIDFLITIKEPLFENVLHLKIQSVITRLKEKELLPYFLSCKDTIDILTQLVDDNYYLHIIKQRAKTIEDYMLVDELIDILLCLMYQTMKQTFYELTGTRDANKSGELWLIVKSLEQKITKLYNNFT